MSTVTVLHYDIEKCHEVVREVHCGFHHKETGEVLFDNDHVIIATYLMNFEGDELTKAALRAAAAQRSGYYSDYEAGAVEVWFGNPPRVKRKLPRVLRMTFHPLDSLPLAQS